MQYLIAADFKKLIQTDNLNQIIGGDSSLLSSAILSAVSELTSYLVQKYDCSREFSAMLPWSNTTVYKANDRVYLDAIAYSATSAYAVGDLALQAGNVYRCKSAIVSPGEAFNASHWDLLGAQYEMFYVKLPYPEFNYETIYTVGTNVFWKDKTYQAQKSTVIPNHVTQIQYDSYSSIPERNIAPDISSQFWGTGTTYQVNAGTLPTDTSKWIKGDSRNPQLVNYCVDIALYTLHSRIAPRNIPELRVKRYDEVIDWLKNAAQGKHITANLPKIQPKQGNRIRYGGNVKNINTP